MQNNIKIQKRTIMNEVKTKTRFYPNGQIEFELPLHEDTGLDHGIVKFWHENGNLKSIFLRINGKTHRIIQFYNSNGTRFYVKAWNMQQVHGVEINFRYGRY